MLRQQQATINAEKIAIEKEQTELAKKEAEYAAEQATFWKTSYETVQGTTPKGSWLSRHKVLVVILGAATVGVVAATAR